MSRRSPARSRRRGPAAAARPATVRAAIGRRATVLAAVVAAGLAGACRRGGVVEDDRRELALAAQTADSLRTTPAVSDARAVALGYFERLRLGVTAPFRLVEQAAGDPRLPPGLRPRIAWALIDQLRRGDAFEPDTAALGDGPDAPPTVLVDGGWHRAFIDSLVRAAPAARTGEETARLTYALARAEWLVTPQTAAAAVNAAALARDRRLAQSDAERLLAAPLTAGDSTRLLLARSWRIGRLFTSERPLLADDLAPDHARAVQDAERALTILRTVALAPHDSAAHDSTALDRTVRDSALVAPAFPLAAAARLSALPSVRLGVPSPPIVVSLGGFRHDALGDAAGNITAGNTAPNDAPSAAAQQLRSRFVARARTDESLAAEWALTRAAIPLGDPTRQQLARAVLAAAVAARSGAQDAPAFAAANTPDAERNAVTTLQYRDGVREVSIDPTLPPAWGPHIATTLSAATADLRSILPNLALDGLTLRIGDSPKHDLALALHDPSRHTVYLPPLTAAGTLAHELAHDLDWQTARTQLGVRGVYASDRAVRDATGDRTLADAVRTMSGVHTTLAPTTRGALGAPPPGRGTDDSSRPAELFARGVDFFVAASLAREGRSDGTLTAVQDPLLVGYAGVRAPDPGDGTAEALVDVLDAMTLVPPTARQWYLARFGREGTRTPLAVVNDVLHATPTWDAEGTLRADGVPGGLSGGDGPAADGTWPGQSAPRRDGCRTGPGGGAPAPWQARLLWLAADARARGFVRARALRAAAAGGAWWGWSAQPLLGGPWRPEFAAPAVDRLRDAFLRAAAGERERRLPFANAGGGCPW